MPMMEVYRQTSSAITGTVSLIQLDPATCIRLAKSLFTYIFFISATPAYRYAFSLIFGRANEKDGRGERIRTSDPLVPNQVRYQTALRPECTAVRCRQKRSVPWGSSAWVGLLDRRTN